MLIQAHLGLCLPQPLSPLDTNFRGERGSEEGEEKRGSERASGKKQSMSNAFGGRKREILGGRESMKSGENEAPPSLREGAIL